VRLLCALSPVPAGRNLAPQITMGPGEIRHELLLRRALVPGNRTMEQAQRVRACRVPLLFGLCRDDENHRLAQRLRRGQRCHARGGNEQFRPRGDFHPVLGVRAPVRSISIALAEQENTPVPRPFYAPGLSQGCLQGFRQRGIGEMRVGIDGDFAGGMTDTRPRGPTASGGAA
jgi:hypothetical protein